MNYYPEIEKITKNNNEEYNINYIIDYIYELQKIFIEFFDKGDVLNELYREFNMWDKNNDKDNGVVLTPDHIVEIMV